MCIRHKVCPSIVSYTEYTAHSTCHSHNTHDARHSRRDCHCHRAREMLMKLCAPQNTFRLCFICRCCCCFSLLFCFCCCRFLFICLPRYRRRFPLHLLCARAKPWHAMRQVRVIAQPAKTTEKSKCVSNRMEKSATKKQRERERGREVFLEITLFCRV